MRPQRQEGGYISPEDLTERQTYFLLTGLVVPRPIAWVSTVSADGERNLAPYSYFNACSHIPPIVHISPANYNKRPSGGGKDTLNNIRETGEFVVNIVGAEMGQAMVTTSASVEADIDEFEVAGLEEVPSRSVKPGRVSGVPAALECKLLEIVPMGLGNVIFGEVIDFYVAEGILQQGRVSVEALRPLGRLGGSYYAEVKDAYSIVVPEGLPGGPPMPGADSAING
jgi:flavin reductase (DIM6/NTAB) family NADH-FMN oxidoreductase RutF